MTRRKHAALLRNCQRGPLTLQDSDESHSSTVRRRSRRSGSGYLVTRAALRAAKAMTTPGLEPQQRLETLMDVTARCSGRAAR